MTTYRRVSSDIATPPGPQAYAGPLTRGKDSRVEFRQADGGHPQADLGGSARRSRTTQAAKTTIPAPSRTRFGRKAETVPPSAVRRVNSVLLMTWAATAGSALPESSVMNPRY